MDTNKMREQFEVWALAEGLSLNTRYGTYFLATTEKAWRSWKASREAVAVELPSPMDAPPYASYEGGWNDMRDEAVDGIKEQGLKVKAREVKP